MPRKFLKRFLPSPDKIKSYRVFRSLNNFLHRDDLWHIHQRCIAMSFFVGVFVAFIPTPAHTLIVVLLSVLLRANVIMAFFVSLINNPITMAPIFYFDYFVGSRITGSHLQQVNFELSWDWLFTALPRIGFEMFLGAFLCGLILGGLAYIIIRLVWRWKVASDWKLRRLKRIS